MIDAALKLKTTPEMRNRIRELAKRTDMDDYDRAVLLLLEDFARCMVLLGVMSEYKGPDRAYD
jgi:hypothetical protein